MKRKVILIWVVISISLYGCGKKQASIDKSNDEQSEFNEKKEIKETEPDSKTSEDYVQMDESIGDFDYNGQDERIVITQINDGAAGVLDLYFNGELIYEYEDLLKFDMGEAKFIDLDDDDLSEIFLSFYPYVNSMPLMEYIVLKETTDGWKTLEMLHGEDMLDNSFPIHVKYGAKSNLIDISCDGYDQVITYDIKAHYEAKLLEIDQTGDTLYFSEWNDILTGSNYEANADFGDTLPWGIWEISTTSYRGYNCLKALQVIAGPSGKYDILGDINIYFNYTSDGKVNILNMEFIPEEL